ncbi:hypothetical protein VOLCADRAFT_91564 [Volvox carteri f. nagariensis]|uniref:Uncharacterized protein n=1 Tax=Volvox carteri f. nagariensis TaxID=3068 RepID=D8TXE6_VOLCA|nr:uncharacterized protein VOLCADRAFT_91564 [Volvox carteri f. nagariensis]EFJ47896.1 hypothetical protein VOLCADRAFT_91564 [Volvox carteri f. nagariensis]|eukprot:XP_002951002.1 hypothetical protein VOLCADRAFT_91564 [Volvox carteri f. nagariensis]
MSRPKMLEPDAAAVQDCPMSDTWCILRIVYTVHRWVVPLAPLNTHTPSAALPCKEMIQLQTGLNDGGPPGGSLKALFQAASPSGISAHCFVEYAVSQCCAAKWQHHCVGRPFPRTRQQVYLTSRRGSCVQP